LSNSTINTRYSANIPLTQLNTRYSAKYPLLN